MKILELLGMSNEERTQKNLIRVGNQLRRNQEKLIDDLEARKDALEAKKDSLETINPSSNLDSWNANYHQTVLDLKLAEKEIEIAANIMKEFFTNNEKTK